MKALGHGANVAQMAAKYGKSETEITDFSSNINPFVKEGLKDKLEEILMAAKSYPDIEYTELRKKISCYLNCGKEEVIVGNGATEIMYLLMKSLGNIRLGIVNPTFSEYERSAKLSGMSIVDLQLEETGGEQKTFTLSEKVVKEKLEAVDALFICNPNNPTGNAQDLEWLVRLLKAEDKWLIADETFMEFVEEEDRLSLVPYVKEYEKLIVIKAITKFYGLPGLRLGYGVTSHEALLEKMYDYKEPWTVNSFAEQLTGVLLEDAAYKEKSRAYFKKERQRMTAALKGIEELTVYETDTNFVLLKLQHQRAEDVKEALFKDYNLLIRDASNFKGLNEHFIRVAVKTQEENNQLIAALKEILGEAA